MNPLAYLGRWQRARWRAAGRRLLAGRRPRSIAPGITADLAAIRTEQGWYSVLDTFGDPHVADDLEIVLEATGQYPADLAWTVNRPPAHDV